MIKRNNSHVIEWAGRQALGAPGPKIVLLALAHWADEFGECWPSVRRIAEWTEFTERSVHSHLKTLIERGIVDRSVRHGFSRRSGEIFSTFYRLALPDDCQKNFQSESFDSAEIEIFSDPQEQTGRRRGGLPTRTKTLRNKSISHAVENFSSASASPSHTRARGSIYKLINYTFKILKPHCLSSSVVFAESTKKPVKPRRSSETIDQGFCEAVALSPSPPVADFRPESLPDSGPNAGFPPPKTRFTPTEAAAIFERCFAAAGPGLGDPAKNPGLHLTKTRILAWLKSGLDLELDVLPVIAARTANSLRPPITTWSYFDAAMRERIAIRELLIAEKTTGDHSAAHDYRREVRVAPRSLPRSLGEYEPGRCDEGSFARAAKFVVDRFRELDSHGASSAAA